MDTLFEAPERKEFEVDLDVFSGPFSVLLSLIAKKRLDVTEIALAEVTDEFVAFIRERSDFDLSQASEFLVVAATLLDLKASRLLPHEENDEEDLELLEQRDLLFAKLLQYRAFKDVAADIGQRLAEQQRFVARDVALEPQYANALPEVRLSLGLADLAMLAAIAMTREQSEPQVALAHLHDPLVPVSTQVGYIRERLTAGDRVTFASLCSDALNLATVVSRFLALLELLRSREVVVEQSEALASLVIRPSEGDGTLVTDEWDEEVDVESRRPRSRATKEDTSGN